jgi:MoaA/NifB/PqqE/SkfB family radical SAM enzyme
MVAANTVKWLQVEATTKCNAWCPGCARNYGGFELQKELVLQDLDISRYQEILDLFPNLEYIDFCGTYGDAIAAANLIELIELSKHYAKKIIVRTNGSLRTANWWGTFASLLKTHENEVWFCLDGLADTHSIYRQATNFDMIIRNATQFIQAGGTAVWQFIPWAHNEHQISDCIRLSQKLGFARFEIVRAVRNDRPARHWRTGEPITLESWSRNNVNNKLLQPKTNVPTKNCQHLSQPGYYVSASGELSTCCYLQHVLRFDMLNQTPDIANELLQTPRPICLHRCGE